MTELHTPNPVGTILFLFIRALPWLAIIAVIVFLVIILLKKIPQPYSKRIAILIISAICSVIIVFHTLSLPKTINYPKQQYNMTCGWPMPFVMFDSTREPPNYAWTDSCIRWAGSPMDTKKEFLWIPFLINVILVSGGIVVLTYALRRVIKHNKEKLKKSKNSENDH